MINQHQRKIVILIFLFIFTLPTFALSSERRTGEWTQYGWYQGKWSAMGTFVVYKQAGNYMMTPKEQRTGVDFTNSKGLFAVSFTGAEWRFKSDWGNNHIGTFILNKAGPGMYSGWSYLGNKKMQQNVWLLTK